MTFDDKLILHLISEDNLMKNIFFQLFNERNIITHSQFSFNQGKIDFNKKNIVVCDQRIEQFRCLEIIPCIEIGENKRIKNSVFFSFPVNIKNVVDKILNLHCSYNKFRKTYAHHDMFFYPFLKKILINQSGSVEIIDLSEKEAQLLLFLENHQAGATKWQIQKEVFDYSEESQTHTVETHIYRIKSKHKSLHELLKVSNNGKYHLS